MGARRRGGGGAAVAAVAVWAGWTLLVPSGSARGPERGPASRCAGCSTCSPGGRRGDARSVAGPGAARLRRARAGPAAAVARGPPHPAGARAAAPGHADRRAAGLVAWVAFKVGRALVRRRLRDHPADAGRRGRARHWMTYGQFLNAVALGQITPGPVVQTVAVVGYAAAGLLGGLLAALVAFAPSFAFVLRRRPALRPAARDGAQAFLDGAGPAAIGAILGSAVPLARALERGWQFAVLAARPCCCWRCGAASYSPCWPPARSAWLSRYSPGRPATGLAVAASRRFRRRPARRRPAFSRSRSAASARIFVGRGARVGGGGLVQPGPVPRGRTSARSDERWRCPPGPGTSARPLPAQRRRWPRRPRCGSRPSRYRGGRAEATRVDRPRSSRQCRTRRRADRPGAGAFRTLRTNLPFGLGQRQQERQVGSGRGRHHAARPPAPPSPPGRIRRTCRSGRPGAGWGWSRRVKVRAGSRLGQAGLDRRGCRPATTGTSGSKLRPPGARARSGARPRAWSGRAGRCRPADRCGSRPPACRAGRG